MGGNKMFKIVKKAVDEFNPFCLLPDAPDDEFDSESRDIAGRINVNSTVEEIASIISSVFSRSFDEIFELKYCMKTAEKIHHSINQRE
jgi:hypothetical protein